MVPAKETAEEQLLRMIEGPGGPPSSSRPRNPSVERVAAGLRGWAEGLWRRLLPFRPHRETSDVLLWRLRIAERLAWIVLAGLPVYLVVDLWVVQPRLPTLKPLQAPAATGGADRTSAAMAEDHLKPLAEYREALVTRNPFGLAIQKISEAVGGAQEKSRLAQLAGSLTVVGINRGRIPEALIEDTAAKRTVVVKVGDQVNKLTVKSISQDGVVVTYEGEETTIK